MLALTSTDLWPGDGWNFVFGQASLRDRVGVWSTARFGDAEKSAQLLLRRVLHVATHETGHIFGIKHCTAYECCMNGANHQVEGDRSPLAFCCECDAKLAWAANANTKDRATKLAEFMKKIQFPQESEHWNKLATLL
jgi:archaemetzincin